MILFSTSTPNLQFQLVTVWDVQSLMRVTVCNRLLRIIFYKEIKKAHR